VALGFGATSFLIHAHDLPVVAEHLPRRSRPETPDDLDEGNALGGVLEVPRFDQSAATDVVAGTMSAVPHDLAFDATVDPPGIANRFAGSTPPLGGAARGRASTKVFESGNTWASWTSWNSGPRSREGRSRRSHAEYPPLHRRFPGDRGGERPGASELSRLTRAIAVDEVYDDVPRRRWALAVALTRRLSL